MGDGNTPIINELVDKKLFKNYLNSKSWAHRDATKRMKNKINFIVKMKKETILCRKAY